MAEMDTMEMWINQKLEKVRVILFESKEQADETLAKMNELLDLNGFVSIAEIGEIVGAAKGRLDSQWGWDEIKTTIIFKIKHAWVLTWIGQPIPIHTQRRREQ